MRYNELLNAGKYNKLKQNRSSNFNMFMNNTGYKLGYLMSTEDLSQSSTCGVQLLTGQTPPHRIQTIRFKYIKCSRVLTTIPRTGRDTKQTSFKSFKRNRYAQLNVITCICIVYP